MLLLLLLLILTFLLLLLLLLPLLLLQQRRPGPRITPSSTDCATELHLNTGRPFLPAALDHAAHQAVRLPAR
jgi:hypothetical protein